MRQPGLDLLRALAILWVLLFHGLVEGLGAPFPLLARTGWMAVDLFFVLSGFLIASQLFASFASGQPHPIRRFYLRRLFRIVPAYVVMVALYALLPRWREAPGLSPVWQFLTYTQNFLIDYQHNRAFSHAWSLCVEEHFYLLFPWLAWAALARPSPRWVVGSFVLVFVGGCFLRAWLWHHTLADGAVLAAAPWRFVETVYYPSSVRCDGLLVGVILASICQYRPAWWSAATSRPWLTGFAGLLLSAFAVFVALPRATAPAVVFGYPLLALGFGLLLVAVVAPRSVFSRVDFPGARLLATITFSVYLSHKLTWHVVRTFAPALVPPGTAQAFLVYGAAALLGGGLLYLAIERPFLQLRQRLRPPAAAS